MDLTSVELQNNQEEQSTPNDEALEDQEESLATAAARRHSSKYTYKDLADLDDKKDKDELVNVYGVVRSVFLEKSLNPLDKARQSMKQMILVDPSLEKRQKAPVVVKVFAEFEKDLPAVEKPGDIIRFHRIQCKESHGETVLLTGRMKIRGLHSVVWNGDLGASFSPKATSNNFTCSELDQEMVKGLRSWFPQFLERGGLAAYPGDLLVGDVQPTTLDKLSPKTYGDLMVSVLGVLWTKSGNTVLRVWDATLPTWELTRVNVEEECDDRMRLDRDLDALLSRYAVDVFLYEGFSQRANDIPLGGVVLLQNLHFFFKLGAKPPYSLVMHGLSQNMKYTRELTILNDAEPAAIRLRKILEARKLLLRELREGQQQNGHEEQEEWENAEDSFRDVECSQSMEVVREIPQEEPEEPEYMTPPEQEQHSFEEVAEMLVSRSHSPISPEAPKELEATPVVRKLPEKARKTISRKRKKQKQLEQPGASGGQEEEEWRAVSLAELATALESQEPGDRLRLPDPVSPHPHETYGIYPNEWMADDKRFHLFVLRCSTCDQEFSTKPFFDANALPRKNCRQCGSRMELTVRFRLLVGKPGVEVEVNGDVDTDGLIHFLVRGPEATKVLGCSPWMAWHRMMGSQPQRTKVWTALRDAVWKRWRMAKCQVALYKGRKLLLVDQLEEVERK